MAKSNAHRTKTDGTRTTAALIFMCFAAIIWAAHLTLIYGTVTVACVRGITADIVLGLNLPALAVIGVTIVALAAIAAGSYWLNREGNRGNAEWREERQFERRVTRWLALLAAFGVFWAGVAVFFVSPCLGLR